NEDRSSTEEREVEIDQDCDRPDVHDFEYCKNQTDESSQSHRHERQYDRQQKTFENRKPEEVACDRRPFEVWVRNQRVDDQYHYSSENEPCCLLSLRLPGNSGLVDLFVQPDGFDAHLISHRSASPLAKNRWRRNRVPNEPRPPSRGQSR